MSRTRNVVITGAAGGICSEIVNRFVSAGDTVLASDLSADAPQQWRTRWDSDRPTEPALHSP